MKKNRKVLLVFTVVSISFVLSFLISNFNVFFLKSQDRTVKNINYYEVSTADNKQIKLNYDGYVKKLIINFKTKENNDVKIKFKTKDYYGNKTVEEKTETLVKTFNKSVLPINSKVKDVLISFNNDNSIITSIKIDNSVTFNFYLFILFLLSFAAIIIIYCYSKFNLFDKKIEKLFLSLVLIIGSLFIILQPHTTSYSWDDQIHFMNTYIVCDIDGKTDWTSSSSDMKGIMVFGNNIDAFEERSMQNNYLNSHDKVISSENKSRFITYNEIGYVIPGLVMKVCSWLGFSFVMKIIITKFSILLFYSLVMYFAIKIVPRGKRIMSVIGLLPSSIFLATQFSYDSPIIASICLFVAQFLKIIEDDKMKISLKEVLILYVSIIFASFIKAVYIPLILLLLFIPKEKFNNVVQKRYFKLGTIFLCLLVISTFVLPTVSGSYSIGDLRGGSTSVSGQLKNIVLHPFGYMNLLYNTAVKKFTYEFISSSALINYGYISSDIPINLYNLLLLLLVFVVTTDSYSSKNKISNKLKVFNVIINMAVIVLIWTALYLSFTPVGETDIFGVQCRYFIPLLIPVILLTFSNNKISHKIDMHKYDFIIMFISVLIVLWTLFIIFFMRFCQ